MIGFIQAIITATILFLFSYCVSIGFVPNTYLQGSMKSIAQMGAFFGILYCIKEGLKSIFGMSSFFAQFGKNKKKRGKKSSKSSKSKLPKVNTPSP